MRGAVRGAIWGEAKSESQLKLYETMAVPMEVRHGPSERIMNPTKFRDHEKKLKIFSLYKHIRVKK